MLHIPLLSCRTTLALGILALASACNATANALPEGFHRYTSYDADLPIHSPCETGFASPTGFARPQTWWHWINGNISREGIEADLREMAYNGYSMARIFHLDGKLQGPLTFDSDAWYDTFRFATEIAAKYGIGLGIHNCDGWSQAGGPWVTPELSMKELTHAEIRVSGNGQIQSIQLPALSSRLDYSVDVAVLAWPAKRPAELAMHRVPIRAVMPSESYLTLDRKPWEPPAAMPANLGDPAAAGNLAKVFDGKRGNYVTIAHDNSSPDLICGVTIEFEQPFEAAGLFTDVFWIYELPRNIWLEVSDDGRNFEKVCEIAFRQSTAYAQFAPRKAKFWRIVRYKSPDPTERVLKGTVKEHELRIAEFELLQPGERSRAGSPIDNFDAKAGVNATSGNITESSPDYPAAITLRLGEILNLSSRLSSGDVIEWKVPDGEWIIMRVGYTTTGKTNHPASDAGRGLEVDKFDPDAVKLHFDSYSRKMALAAGQNKSLSVNKHHLTPTYQGGSKSLEGEEGSLGFLKAYE